MHTRAEVSPLARRNDADPFLTDRFEFFVGGRELANGFPSSTTPTTRRRDSASRPRAKAVGMRRPCSTTPTTVRALEYGLPPTAGLGIGVDRMVMLFTNQPSIRDVLLFPHMKPEVGG
jgi:lysyl-tRNA synthetase class 2